MRPLTRVAGAVPVLVMPFDEAGAVDEDSLRRQVDFCVEAGGQIGLHKTIFQRAGILRSAYCRIGAAPQPAWVMERVWAHLKAAGLLISRRLRA